MFISFDNGAHWQTFGRNMPNVPIQDIKLHRKDLVVATQGRALWIMDNVSALHQITPQVATQDVHLYRPRDGYRTRDGSNILGPNIEYRLASAPSDEITIEILDAGGEVANTYRSGAQAQAGGGRRGGGGGDDPDEMMMAGRGRGGAGGGPRVTKNAGHNRFVWDVRHRNGLSMPPGQYTAKLTVNGMAHTQPFNVLIDPRIAAEGTTVADLAEQYQHNTRMGAMVAEGSRLGARLRQAQNRLADASGAAADTLKQVNALALELSGESVRYGQPGLQTHITYLAGMTARTDQKIGRDAIARHAVLRRELDDLTARVNRLLGPDRS
jgi:hypothetical protein